LFTTQAQPVALCSTEQGEQRREKAAAMEANPYYLAKSLIAMRVLLA